MIIASIIALTAALVVPIVGLVILGRIVAEGERALNAVHDKR